MANVSQKIQTFLGGVSRKADFDKLQGQVVEANNCYPDETYGMIKRPGTELLGSLGIDYTTANSLYFFPLLREGQPRYLVGVGSGTIRMWNLDDPSITITVTTPDGTSYLNYTSLNNIPVNDAYRSASDDRRTVIINRTKTCAENNDLWSSTTGYTTSFQWTLRNKNKDNNSIDDLPDGRAVRINWGFGGDPNLQVDRPLREGIHYLPVSVTPKITNSQGQTESVKTEGFGCVLKCNVTCGGVIRLKGVWRLDSSNVEQFVPFHAQFGTDADGNCTFTGYHDDDGNTITTQTGDRIVYDAEIWSAGSGYPDQCPVTIDGIEGSRATLATGLLPAMVYRVVNSGADTDDFYMQAFSNSSEEDDASGVVPGPRDRLDGPYVWKECPSPDSKRGLDPASLPHELVVDPNNSNTFIFRQVDYSDRWAGDDNNNPAPSFIGSTINNAFFMNNRLGFLSEDNVILSRPINYGPAGSVATDYVPNDNAWVRRNYTEIDFFRQSAIGMTDADPIDIKAANNDVSIFHTAINTPQGTILFADGQQSLLFQPQGLLSPLTASINSLSNYDMTGDVNAVIVGEQYFFVNKGAKFCRIYSMINQGMQNPPVIEDVTKEVTDWLPNDITDLIACPTDNMIFAFNRIRQVVYCRRGFNRAGSWTKWTLPRSILHLAVDHDQVFFITNSGTDTTISRARLNVLPDDYSLNEYEEEEAFSNSEANQETTPETRTFTTAFYDLEIKGIHRQRLIIDDIDHAGGSYWCTSGDLVFEESERLDYVLSDNDQYYQRAVYTFTPQVFEQEFVCNDGTGDFDTIAPKSCWKGTAYRDSNHTGSSFDQTFLHGRTNIFSGGQPLTYRGSDQIRNVRLEITAEEFVDKPDPDPVATLHCGPNPPAGYERVRFKGTYTNVSTVTGSTPTSSPVYLRVFDDPNLAHNITTHSITSDWYYPNVSTAQLQIGGSWFTYFTTPVQQQKVILDNAWVNINNATTKIEGTSWTNYEVDVAGSGYAVGDYVGDSSVFGVPWRSKSYLNCNGFFHSYGQTIGSMGLCALGYSKGSAGNAYGGLWKNGRRPDIDTNDFDFYVQFADGNVPLTDGIVGAKIEGYWEFERGDETIIWYGYDSDGTLRSEAECPNPISGLVFDPYLDFYTEPTSVSGKVITAPSDFPILDDVPLCYLITNLPGQNAVESDRIGYTGSITIDENGALNADREIEFFPGTLVIGYRYNFQLVLPTFYFNQGESNFDYTASLTVARVKFALGFSGEAEFDINVRNGTGWESSYSQVIANDYSLSTSPVSTPSVVSVPVHKRNIDFQLQVKSDSPFPLSVDSCMWEGIYSPRYYRRI